MPGRRFIRKIEERADLVTRHWLADIRSHPTTPSYHEFDEKELYERSHRVLSQLGVWLEYEASRGKLREYYLTLGRERFAEGFGLPEVLSCLALLKRHIWSYVLKEGYVTSLADHVAAIDLYHRVAIFFDRACYYASAGYTEALMAELIGRGVAGLADQIRPRDE